MNAALSAADKPTARIVTGANKSLAAGNYDRALEDYRKAAKKLPGAPELAYNQAVVHYRKKDFEKASELFVRALATREPALEAKTKFNLGNCAYSQALQNQDNLQEAIGKLRVAIDYYKDTIDLDPHDLDARANIETAQLLIRDLLDKQKQQQEREEQEKKEKEQKDKEKQDPTSQPTSQPQSQPQSQPASQPSGQEQKKEEQKQENQQGKDQENKDQQQQDQQQQAGQQQQKQDDQAKQDAQPVPIQIQMTPEEAEKLLQLIRDKEKQRREEQALQMEVIKVPVDKDW